MAIKVLKTSSDLSTSSAYENVEAYNLVSTTMTTSTYYRALNTTTTINVTFANAGNQLGLLLFIRQNASSGTITVVLKEGSTTRTTDVFTFTSNETYSCGWLYIPLTSYAVTTASSTWKYEITSSTSNISGLTTTASSTDLVYAVTLDTAASKIGSGDVLFLGNDVALTIDEDLTLGNQDNRSLMMCLRSAINWETSPSSSHTWSMTGTLWCHNFGSIEIGTSANPIPASAQAVIDMSGGTNAFSYGSTVISYWNASKTTYSTKFYGEYSEKTATRIASNASSGQATFTTTDDMSADWSAGDTLSFVGLADDIEYATYTIDSISGTSITLTGNLAYNLLGGGGVINLSENDQYGIICKGPSTGYTYLNQWLSPTCEIEGVYFENMGACGLPNPSTLGTYFTLSTLVKNCLFNNARLGYMAAVILYPNVVLENLYEVVTYSAARANSGIYLNTCKNATVVNIFTKNGYNISLGTFAGIALVGNKITASGLVHSGGRVRADVSLYPYNSMYFGGSGCTINDVFCYVGGQNCGVYISNFNASTMNGIRLDGAADTNILFGNSVDVIINDAYLGETIPAGVSEISVVTDTLNRVTFDEPFFGSYVATTSNTDNMIPSSYISFSNFQKTPVDNRVKYVYGNLNSTGDGLTDTTVHTSGTGKFAIRLEPTYSTDRLEWEFDVPTGNIQNKTMTVGVWCKINSATYYAGTHQLPRLTINYDNGTTAYHQAGETTDWQLLTVSFTPTTTYGQITVTLSGRTDATSTDAYIYWDDFTVAYPPSVALDLGGMDNWANALPVTPPIALPISAGTVAQSVWQQLTTTSWGTNSMGEDLKGKQDTITYIVDGEIPI